MRIYKELIFVGDKKALDEFKNIASSLAHGDWKYVKPDGVMKEYIAFDYYGDKVDSAEVSIFCGEDSWREGYIKVGNIVPLQKNQLSIVSVGRNRPFRVGKKQPISAG